MQQTRRTPVLRVAWWLTAFICGAFSMLPAGVARGADVAIPERAGGTYADWVKHRDTLLNDPSVVRYYTFGGTGGAGAPVPNLAGDKSGPLLFQRDPAPGAAPDGFRRVAGRWPAAPAVRLDQGDFAGPAPDGLDRAFTATLWFRKLGQGARRGNDGAANGMLLADGNGYYEGWRVTTAYPSLQVGFEIGRPGGSVGCTTPAVADGVWHHLAASWDGGAMRVYVDGEPVAARAYTGTFTPPGPGSRFRIGFADSGIGSVVVDVNEAVLYRRALSPEEVFRDAYFYARLTPAQMAHWSASMAAANRHDDPRGERELAALLAMPGLHPDVAALVRLHLSDRYEQRGASMPAALLIGRVLDAPGLAARLRAQARERLLTLLQESAGAPLPRRLYDRLLSQPGTTMPERLALRLNLGHALAATGDYAAARVEYNRIAAAPAAPSPWRRLARLCAARALVAAGDYPAAQRAYRQIQASDASSPPTVAVTAESAEVAERLGEIARIRLGESAADPSAGRVRLPKRATPGLTLYVAPGGRDNDSGTQTRPFATLERARDAIRALRTRGGLPRGGVAVVVQGGTYRLRKTFGLDSRDSGDRARPIVYRAAAGETPVFDAGASVRGFHPVQDQAVQARLPVEAAAHVRETDLRAQGISDFGVFSPGGFGSARGFTTHPLLQLYFNGSAMPLAQWPNVGYVHIAAVAPGARDTFTYDGDRPARWVGEKDAWLYGYWFYNWADSYEKIAAINTQNKTISLAPPVTTYGDGVTSFLPKQPYRAVNVLSELDQPGEWYLDRDSGILYFYPPSDPDRAVVEVSVFDGPVLDMEGVAHVALEGLVWQNGRGDGVIVRGSDSCLLAGCTVRQFGGNGVQILGGRHDGLLSCDINTLGRGGTVITGGDRRTLTPGGHFLENCHIHHFSLVDHTYTPAVLLTGDGNRIAHNRFHDSYSSAMRIEGNDNVIEYNDVGHVIQESDDQGGSDMWANPTYRGNVFRYNYWHDMGSGHDVGQAGIRLDDWISGVLIYGNVFQRCSGGGFGGVQINQGADNLIENNLFIDCKAAISGGAGSLGGWQRFLTSGQGRGYLQDVHPSDPPYARRYPELAHLGQASENSAWRNVVVNCGTFLRSDQAWDLLDNSVSSGNPGFTDPLRSNFSLRPGTPLANRLSFQPIPFDRIGLYRDTDRKGR